MERYRYRNAENGHRSCATRGQPRNILTKDSSIHYNARNWNKRLEPKPLFTGLISLHGTGSCDEGTGDSETIRQNARYIGRGDAKVGDP